MRSILIDWLVEVHLKFKLMPETLYLTVNLIDRYLAKRNVTRKRLQLVGVTAMLIASKYEEIWAPEVRDFVYISDKAYSREDILACEKTMLEVRARARSKGWGCAAVFAACRVAVWVAKPGCIKRHCRAFGWWEREWQPLRLC